LKTSASFHLGSAALLAGVALVAVYFHWSEEASLHDRWCKVFAMRKNLYMYFAFYYNPLQLLKFCTRTIQASFSIGGEGSRAFCGVFYGESPRIPGDA